MIAIVDYQAGNLASVKKAFDHLGYESVITADPAEIARASKIVCRAWEISRPPLPCQGLCKRRS